MRKKNGIWYNVRLTKQSENGTESETDFQGNGFTCRGSRSVKIVNRDLPYKGRI